MKIYWNPTSINDVIKRFAFFHHPRHSFFSYASYRVETARHVYVSVPFSTDVLCHLEGCVEDIMLVKVYRQAFDGDVLSLEPVALFEISREDELTF